MIHSVEEWKIYSYFKNISWNHFTLFKSSKDDFTKFLLKSTRINFRNMISAHNLKKFREINLQFWFTKTVDFTEFSLQTIWEFLCNFYTVLSHTLGCQLLKFDVIWRIFFVVNEKSSFHTACFVGSMGKLALLYCVE